MSEPEPERLRDVGQVYVTLAAAQAYARWRDMREEEARRELTVVLLDARQVGETRDDGSEAWRYRSRPKRLDVTATVSYEGELAVVVRVNFRPHGPKGHA